MNLTDAIERLTELERTDVLFVRKPWTPSADTLVAPLDGDLRVPSSIVEAGFVYFLEVPLCHEILEVFGDRKPSLPERVRLLLHYAETDAYPDWVYES